MSQTSQILNFLKDGNAIVPSIEIYKRKPLSEETKRKIGLANSKPKIKIICKLCGKEFFTYPARANKAKFCSYKCMGTNQKNRIPWNKGTKGICKANSGSIKKGQFLGENHPNWKGGRYLSQPGKYIYFYLPQHPHSNNDGYVFEHRLVMEKHLKRYLNPKEMVHHINKIRDDNRIENLVLFKNSSEHHKHHWIMGDLKHLMDQWNIT